MSNLDPEKPCRCNEPAESMKLREEVSARVTLASAEREIAEQVLLAAKLYGSDPNALKLRQMNLLYEMNKDRGATVLIPTDMAASLGTMVGLTEALTGTAAAAPPTRQG